MASNIRPRSAWGYGAASDWAGIVVEKLNNCALEDYMRANICEPLGMTDTTHVIDPFECSNSFCT